MQQRQNETGRPFEMRSGMETKVGTMLDLQNLVRNQKKIRLKFKFKMF